MKMIYLDNAATTKMDEMCINSFIKYGIENFYNPSSLYQPSVEVSRAIKEAREGLLSLLRGVGGELIFTASGTEADNMAVFGTRKTKNSRIIISAGEHQAVNNPALELKQRGFQVDFAPLNNDGSLNILEFTKLLSDDVSFISIMHVNNETGAVNDLQQISKLIRRLSPNAIFHSDGVQALGKVNINLKALDVDLYSVSAHKIHAPKGIGALYIKDGIRVSPIIFGGGQEKGLRSATENVASIDAFYQVAKKVLGNIDEMILYKKSLLEHLRKRISLELPSAKIISPECSPHILMIALENIRGEVMMHSLEEFGILTGIGSACSSKKGISRFKTLFNLDKTHEEGILRISIDTENTFDELDFFVDRLKIVSNKLTSFKRI
ncbi:MAG: cysteine desulfurase family protein [Clostridia bacterium]